MSTLSPPTNRAARRFRQAMIPGCTACRTACGLLALTLTGATSLFAQATSSPPDSARVERVEVRPAELKAPAGSPVRFEAVAYDASGKIVEGLPVSWFPDSYQQVQIDSTGQAIGREVGTVRIGAAVGGKVGTGLLITTELPVAALELRLPGGADRLFTGQSVRLETEATTTLGTRAAVGTGVMAGLELRYGSSNPAVAEVSALGRVVGRQPGTATITVQDVRGPAKGRLAVKVEPNPVARLDLQVRGVSPGAGTPGRTTLARGGGTAAARTGDVLRLDLGVRDRRGRSITDTPVVLGVTSPGAAAWMEPDGGRLVAEEPGIYTVVASVGNVTAQTDIVVGERESTVEVVPVGRAVVSHTLSTDFAMFEGLDGRDYLIQGTIPGSKLHGVPTEIGDRYYVWDITDPTQPALTDSVLVNARRASDPRVEPNRRWAVITHEGDPERKNGITFIDLSMPAHPKVIGRFTERLTGGVHNVWIDGHYVFAVSNGPNSLVIVDASDPANPRITSEFGLSEGWRRVLHDIWVEDGLAYLSYWLDGLVIVDVGNGIAGGSVEKPVQVSQLLYDMEPLYGTGLIAGTHTAWREGNYVFVGDEVFPWEFREAPLPALPRGRIHVVDVSDIRHPRIVAFYEVPEAGSHCVWVQDGKLYIANYQAGLRVVDVTGELRGNLYAQGRELARFDTSAPLGQAAIPFKADAWGIQLYKGRIFVADSNSGTWILELREKRDEKPAPLAPRQTG
jgi:hypothetical protein